MECNASEIKTYLASSNLPVNNFDEQVNLSLVHNLKDIERCIESKNFSHGLDIVREMIKKSPEVNINNIKNDELINNLEQLRFGALQIEKKIGKVILNKQVIDLTTNEFSLLIMLVERPDQTISRDILHESILKTEYDGLNRSIDNTISRIRKKLGDNNLTQLKIKSIRGKGYLFTSNAW